MNFWARIEQALWTGRVTKDYGPVLEDHRGIVRHKMTALLANRGGRDRFVIKDSYVALLGFSVQYLDLDRESALKLKTALDDAVALMR